MPSKLQKNQFRSIQQFSKLNILIFKRGLLSQIIKSKALYLGGTKIDPRNIKLEPGEAYLFKIILIQETVK